MKKSVELALYGNETCLRIALDKLLPRIKPENNFTEARIDSFHSLYSSRTSNSEKEQTFSIELHRSNNVILKINAMPIAVIQKIISQFME